MKLWILFIIIPAILIFDLAMLIWWKVRSRNSRALGFLNYSELLRQTNLNVFGAGLVGTILNIFFAPVALFYWMHKLCTWHPSVKNNSVDDRRW